MLSVLRPALAPCSYHSSTHDSASGGTQPGVASTATTVASLSLSVHVAPAARSSVTACVFRVPSAASEQDRRESTRSAVRASGPMVVGRSASSSG